MTYKVPLGFVVEGPSFGADHSSKSYDVRTFTAFKTEEEPAICARPHGRVLTRIGKSRPSGDRKTRKYFIR
jgi:hypothetical protein